MTENCHTHTFRCRHAVGTEEEYIRTGIARGLKVLGFSDHSPYMFPDGYYSGFRMAVRETPGYFRTLGMLRNKYRGQIEIPIGFEVEYYPDYFEKTLDLYRRSAVTLENGERVGCEYLILGQHFLGNEFDDPEHCMKPTRREERLALFVDTTISAMELGVFTYVAHPDLLNYTGPDAVYEKHMKRLCQAARELNVPLEINLLGLDEKRNYPRGLFFDIAAETGNTVVFGCDAHQPGNVARQDLLLKAEAFAREHHVTITEHIPLKKLDLLD